MIVNFAKTFVERRAMGEKCEVIINQTVNVVDRQLDTIMREPQKIIFKVSYLFHT